MFHFDWCFGHWNDLSYFFDCPACTLWLLDDELGPVEQVQ